MNTKVQWQGWERNTVGKMDPIQKDGCVRYAEHTFFYHMRCESLTLYFFFSQRLIARA